MQKTFKKRMVALGAAVMSLLLVISCVNEKYEVSKEHLDLNVTVFQEGISLPLGSTEKIRLDSIIRRLGIEDEFDDFIKTAEDGSFSFFYKADEPFDASDQLSSLSGLLDIDKLTINEDFEFSLEDIDMSGVSYAGKIYEVNEDISDKFEDFAVDVPEIRESFSLDAKIRDYYATLGEVDLAIDLGEHGGDITLSTIPSGVTFPDALASDETEYTLSEISAILGQTFSINSNIENASVQTNISHDFPKEVKSVSELHIAEGAKLLLSVEVVNPCFSSGQVVPHVDLNLSELFHLADESGVVHDDHIDTDFILSKENGWKASGEYDIISVLLDPAEDWKTAPNGAGETVLRLDKDVDVSVTGNLNDGGLKTNCKLLKEWLDVNTDREVKINVKLEFSNLTIDDVTMEINPISVTKSEIFDLNIPSMKFPNEVSSVEDVKFTDASVIDIDMIAERLSTIGNLDFALEQMKITFPDKLIIDGADANNSVIVSGGSFTGGALSRQIRILGINIGELDENGYIPAYDGVVTVEAAGSVSGEVHTANLPQTKEEDVALSCEISTNIEIADYKLKLRGYEINQETEPDLFKKEEIKIEVPTELADIHGLAVTLKNDPVITIDFTIPEVTVDVRPIGDEGLSILLPEMLVLKKGGYAYEEWMSADGKSLHFPSDRDIPSHLELPVDCLLINPVKDETDGKYYVSGAIEVTGAVGIKEGAEMIKSDIDLLCTPGTSVNFRAEIPSLEPDSVSMDSYTTTLTEEITVEILKDVELPDELKSVGQILLDDVYLSMSVTTGAGFPSIGEDAVLSLGADVTLPSFIGVDDPRFSENKLSVSGTLEKVPGSEGIMRIAIDPIKISSLNLDMTKEELSTLSGNIALDGNVSLTGADLVLDDWLNRTHNLSVSAELATVKNGTPTDKIQIEKVTGQIDYQIDPIETTIDLSEIKDFIGDNGMDITIDFLTFYLALDVQTNLGIPVEATLSALPYYGNETGEQINKSISLGLSESSDQITSTKLWFSNRNVGSPSGAEYVELDVFSLLYKDEGKTQLIDSLKVSINAGTDSEKVAVFEPSADYTLKVDYEAGIPLRLGSEFDFEYRDTISNIPSETAMVLQSASIGIVGEIESSLPVGISLALRFLDSNNQELVISDKPILAEIKSSGPDGEPVLTEFYFVINNDKKTDLSDLKSIELVFMADTGEARNSPFKEQNYIKATLRALVPEGVTVNAKDMEGIFKTPNEE